MLRLALILHAIAATVLMGIGITAVLAAGMVTGMSILVAAAGGFLLAIPLSWLIARKMVGSRAEA